MRIVLDTSTLIAAHISRAGVCAELLEEVLLYEDLFLSDFILTKFENKLRSKFGYTELEVRAAAKFLRAAAEFVQPEKMDESACRDPEDLPILGTAIAARADILITVDRDLLDLTDVRGIAIIQPGQYWKRSRQL